MEETEPEGRQGPRGRESFTLNQPNPLSKEISQVRQEAHHRACLTVALQGSETPKAGVITSLAVLFVAATGVSFVTQMTRASQHLRSFLTCVDLQHYEVSYPNVVACPGD